MYNNLIVNNVYNFIIILFCNIYVRQMQLCNYKRHDFKSIIFFNKSTKIENGFFYVCQKLAMASRYVNESNKLKECLRRREKILLQYCEIELYEWRWRYFGALRRHELCLTDNEWNGTSFCTPPYFLYTDTVLTFSKDVFTWIRTPSKSHLTFFTNWMNQRNNRLNKCIY